MKVASPSGDDDIYWEGGSLELSKIRVCPEAVTMSKVIIITVIIDLVNDDRD